MESTIFFLSLQVISPLTGQVLGREEIRVTKNKESVVKMDVRILTGLHLDVLAEQQSQQQQSPGEERVNYQVRTTYSKKLTAKYQV